MTVEKDIGKLEAQMSSANTRIDELEERMDERLTKIEGYLQEIRDAANMGKGAWWLMLKIGGTLVVIIGGVTWLLEKVWGKPL